MKIMCPNCKTEFMTASGENVSPITTNVDGIGYLVPKVIRNENAKGDKKEARLEALKEAGIDVTKLQTLMQQNNDIKNIFCENDPVIETLSKGGFINNPELFRRWITAQSWRLLKDKYGWTHAVRKTYDIKYVLNQTKRELALLCKLRRKNPNDIRFQFFTLDDMKSIFCDLMDYNQYYWYRADADKETAIKHQIKCCSAYASLYDVVKNVTWKFKWDCSFKPKAWLNCFKGAGAYYTLQNIIRTHGLVIPKCKDMNESLEYVDNVFKSIIGYEPKDRRWDILLSVLTMAVDKTGFELKY